MQRRSIQNKGMRNGQPMRALRLTVESCFLEAALILPLPFLWDRHKSCTARLRAQTRITISLVLEEIEALHRPQDGKTQHGLLCASFHIDFWVPSFSDRTRPQSGQGNGCFEYIEDFWSVLEAVLRPAACAAHASLIQGFYACPDGTRGCAIAMQTACMACRRKNLHQATLLQMACSRRGRRRQVSLRGAETKVCLATSCMACQVILLASQLGNKKRGAEEQEMQSPSAAQQASYSRLMCSDDLPMEELNGKRGL